MNSEKNTQADITEYEDVCEGTKYYVSYSEGDDSNNGTSPSTPVKTLAKASTFCLNAGDGIFFKRGDVWTGETFTFYNSGTIDNPIYISAYGNGVRPVFRLAGEDQVCMRINNSQGLVISSIKLADSYGGLELNYSYTLIGTEAPNGKTYLANENYEREGIIIEDMRIENMTNQFNSDPYQYNHSSFGLVVRNRLEKNVPAAYVLKGLAVRNCSIYRCGTGMNIVCHEGYKFENAGMKSIISDFLIENNVVELCGQWGIHMAGAVDGIVRYNEVKHTGIDDNNFGSCAFLLISCSNVLVDNLTIDGAYRQSGQNWDACGFDFEGDTINCSLVNSTIKNVDGCGVFVFDNSSGKNNVDFLIDNVTFENFAQNFTAHGDHNPAAAITFASSSNGKISNCTFINNQLGKATNAKRWADQFNGGSENIANVIFENNKEMTSSGKFIEWEFDEDGNVYSFANINFTYYKADDNTSEAQHSGSTVDMLYARGGYLHAVFGDVNQYIAGPTSLFWSQVGGNNFYIKVKNMSNATKMTLDYGIATTSQRKQVTFDLPAKGEEKVISVSTGYSRGSISDFKLYVDGKGEILISKMGFENLG